MSSWYDVVDAEENLCVVVVVEVVAFVNLPLLAMLMRRNAILAAMVDYCIQLAVDPKNDGRVRVQRQ